MGGHETGTNLRARASGEADATGAINAAGVAGFERYRPLLNRMVGLNASKVGQLLVLQRAALRVVLELV
jgi:hypothetical protein